VGYPHELWTTRLLARHVRENAETAGHRCLTRLAQDTVCKILDQHEVQPHWAKKLLAVTAYETYPIPDPAEDENCVSAHAHLWITTSNVELILPIAPARIRCAATGA
jgi:hypothetical protein